ncbi:MAG TPA: tetratricopeptide repeat protein [Xanthobacteraceae bacterium]|jgi:TPR repeat protein
MIRTRFLARLAAAGVLALTMAAPTGGAAQPKPVVPSGKPGTPAIGSATGQAAREPDLAFGAFQRGYYITAFSEATRRVEEKADPKAMTLLGELYAQGFGIAADDKKAMDWYRLAVERGDREAMFALAMFHFAGRTGARNRDEMVRLLNAAAALGHAAAAYNLALLYLEGQQFPQDFARAAELFRKASELGNPEAQYALATMFKDGRGVNKDMNEAVRLLAAAAQANNLDATVEYAVAMFNGVGTAKDEPGAAGLFLKAARRGSPIAQNRLARILAAGRGLPLDPVQAMKWHIAAKAGGAGDLYLDEFASKQKAEDRAAAEEAAKPWIPAGRAPRS